MPTIIIVLFTIIKMVISSHSHSCEDVDWTTVNIASELQFNEFRTIDGTGNHPKDLGKAFGETTRCVKPVFGDGFNSLTGENRLNPREISNVLFDQSPEEDPKFLNARHLTQFAWQWGQFIDHDITLISEDRNDNDFNLDIDIYVPCNDPTYDPTGTCDADFTMNVFRTRAFEGTGTGPGNPRNVFNDITAFIDGSMVYGSEDDRANDLREFKDGLLRVSLTKNQKELLPFNDNGLPNEPNDEDNLFIGGDVRVNEQSGLTMMHTLFVRAHNIIADSVIDSVKKYYSKKKDIDEFTYQYTKLILTAMIQKITYKDWLPTMFGPTALKQFVGKYKSYDNSINPGICAIFASSAYRLGHTLLPQKLPRRRKNNCRKVKEDDLELRDAFFVPELIIENPDMLEDLVNGFSCTLANEIDMKITGAVRNFLFESALDDNGDSIFGILDLISLNLQRGRDHGLPNYNQVRKEIGLKPLTSFDQISSDTELNENIKVLYDNDINNIDLFVGVLAEDHFSDGSFGETISAIVLSQFKRLRDGDRFWYENYIKKGPLLDFIESVTLKDILEWSTDMKIRTLDVNDNIFQNKNAISIFDDPKTSKKTYAGLNPGANNVKNVGNSNDGYVTINVTMTQLFELIGMLLGVIIVSTLLCCCVWYKYKRVPIKKGYKQVGMETDTNTQQSSAYDTHV